MEKKNRFYYSEQQKRVAEGRSNLVWVGKGGVGWVEYTEWCSLPGSKCNWDDAILVHETNEFPQIKTGNDVSEEERNYKKDYFAAKDSVVKCSCCGDIIPKGANLWKVHGYTYNCCSAECLLYAMVPSSYVKTCTGEYED